MNFNDVALLVTGGGIGFALGYMYGGYYGWGKGHVSGFIHGWLARHQCRVLGECGELPKNWPDKLPHHRGCLWISKRELELLNDPEERWLRGLPPLGE